MKTGPTRRVLSTYGYGVEEHGGVAAVFQELRRSSPAAVVLGSFGGVLGAYRCSELESGVEVRVNLERE